MTKGLNCKDTKKLCESSEDSKDLEQDESKGSTFIKLREGKDVPANFFCINKIETQNDVMINNSLSYKHENGMS